jgi:hypothetical protein
LTVAAWEGALLASLFWLPRRSPASSGSALAPTSTRVLKSHLTSWWPGRYVAGRYQRLGAAGARPVRGPEVSGMCVSCGCGEPNDDHGDPRHITYDQLKEAAKAGMVTPKEAAVNILTTAENLE